MLGYVNWRRGHSRIRPWRNIMARYGSFSMTSTEGNTMVERLNRRVAALEVKLRGAGPRVLVYSQRRDGDFDRWRSENVAPVEAEGFRPLVVKIRHLSAEAMHQPWHG